ncbi:MAG: GAF domain-containing protein [Deltaproteobacteria bacterium]|nr:GAF domain-containing protein [Deltaproteobacteria bacterium]
MTAIEQNSSTEIDLDQTRQKLESLKEIAINLDTTMSFDEVLTLAVKNISLAINAERTTLFLSNKDGALISRVIEGDETKEIVLPPGHGLAGWTASHKLPLIIDNAYNDERFDPRFDKKSGFKTASVICHPIFGRDGLVIGVIEVLNSKNGAFSKDDVTLLGAVGNQLAMVIENSRLIINLVKKNKQITSTKQDLEKKNSELEILLQLEQILSRSEDIDSLGKNSFSKILNILNAQFGFLYLMNPQGAYKRIYSVDGSVDRIYKVQAGAGFSGWSATKHKEVYVKDPASDPRYEDYIQKRAGITLQNLVAVPLPIDEHNGTIGSILIANKTVGRDFDETDKAILRLIAGQMATAVVHIQEKEQRDREHRLATVGRLLAGVMHDLRTPITTISGYSELLAETTKPKEAREYLAHIKKAIDRIKNMTSDIVSFSRGEKDLLTSNCALDDFIDKYIYDVENYLKSSNVELVVRKRTSGVIKVDQEKLLRAFHNITINAVEAMGDNGRFIFEVDNIQNRIVFSFTDTGTGIPEAAGSSIFNSFVSFGKDNGTGLGLAVAREIISGHGGQISYTSSSTGTTFLVTLPIF